MNAIASALPPFLRALPSRPPPASPVRIPPDPVVSGGGIHFNVLRENPRKSPEAIAANFNVLSENGTTRLGSNAAAFVAAPPHRPPLRSSGTPHSRESHVAADADAPASTSVLINTCNHAAYIEECLESVLVQSVLPDEIIVYDDGSTDDTVARVRRYARRVKLIEGRHLPLAHHVCQANAVQTAFGHSTGKLVFFLDGDDRFKRDKIERYLAAFTVNPDAALIQAPMEKIDEHGRSLGHNVERRKHVIDHLREIYRRQDVDFYYPMSSLAFSRTYLECVLPLDLSDGMPLWMDTRLSVTAPYFGRVITLAEPLSDWRRHTGSVSLSWRRSRRHQLRETLMRTNAFNNFCRRYGLRTISAWRNRRFYLQLLRITLPDRAYGLYYRHFRRRPAPRHMTADC